MLSAEKNELITRTGPGTPCGDLMRRYWQPAALVDELPDERPVAPVRLLGEDLVLFRNPDGSYGLVGRRCPHRGADLAYGRLEDGGLRCTFHGWLFDNEGACIDQPGEPEGSNFKSKIRCTSYPCIAKNGIVFAYMGPDEPPPFPAYDCFAAPESHSFAFKGLWECNWLQALEVGIDPVHASFLHRFLEDEDPADGYGQQFRAETVKDIPLTKLMREYPRPHLEVEETDYGLRLCTLRDLDGETMHIRVTNQVFPHGIVIPMSRTMTITQWHVPIDDTHCWWVAIFTDYDQPVDHAEMKRQRLELYEVPGYRSRKDQAVEYGFDPADQANATYTGMGMDINVHDQWAVESLGPIQDRTNEHLGATDKGITAYRRRLMQAIDDVAAGKPAPMRLENATERPIAVDLMGPAADWQAAWRAHDAERRAASSWFADPEPVPA